MDNLSTQPLHSCPRCHQSFECTPYSATGCVCFQFKIPPQVADFIKANFDSCLCPACLTELIEAATPN
ncbi:hypothetical protein DR864_11365 [Runella rosea]|uniref:Cysteine-rich CWC n=1 Tax=Runella rosea TaxID=2259595 RepID=A0A344TI31_9BACT|nr:hypothetical protein DR864_11365 [Runella rosea]